NVACPEGYAPDADLIANNTDCVTVFEDPREAARGSNLIVTDVWASMGQEDEADARSKVFAPYQVNAELMALAADDALFMHCLPAHRGEEISDDMLDHPGSVVWDEAENRLHAQKALLEFLILGRLEQ
ncbi:MAG: ornithine carbamoyltransferase, partial [Pseudomonadota bacterium]